MTLYEGKKGNRYKIIALKTTDTAIKYRLISMGIYKNAQIKLDNHTLKKSTLSVLVGGVQVALRNSEAREIEVCAL